jgi:hypothetical protein
MGWSESAMIAGARDVGVSPAIVGAFKRKEATLVEVPSPFECIFSVVICRLILLWWPISSQGNNLHESGFGGMYAS